MHDPSQKFVLTLFTSDARLAAQADAAGVDRIGLDLEILGKVQRQGHLNTRISDHTEDHLPDLRACLQRAELFARCNPPHPGQAAEIDRLIAGGVRVLMLPFFDTVDQAQRFVDSVAGRAKTVLLIETAPAARATAELCRLAGADEVHFGLNDLRLSLGWPTHFHVLVSDELARWCQMVHEAGMPCGIAGVGRAHDNDLPIPSDLVLAQLARLGATGSLISRAFFSAWDHDLATEIALVRRTVSDFLGSSPTALSLQRSSLIQLLQR